MLLLRHVERIGRRLRRPVLTLGNFDGVHCGHQAIFRRVVETAAAVDGTPVALTFHPHPAAVLKPGSEPPRLTDLRQRAERIAATGIETILFQRFTQRFSQIHAVDFVERLLVDGLGVVGIVVGHRVSFGHRRSGGADTLRELGAKHGFSVEVVGPVRVDGAEVSSSAIRTAIQNGDLATARSFLGVDPVLRGRVIAGDRRGRQLGFPTANLRVSGWVVPPNGVYAVRALVDGAWVDGVANLGVKPTFGDNARGLEVHLLDWQGDLYDARIEVRFIASLRPEQRFAGLEALVEQIGRDVEAARRCLAQRPR